MPEFNNQQLAYALYAIPRTVTKSNLELMSSDLMHIFWSHGSGTQDSANRYANVDFGPARKRGYDSERLPYGLRLKHFGVLISDIVYELQFVDIPADIQQDYPSLTQDEWVAVIQAIVTILEAFEVDFIHGDEPARMRVFKRALTYRLYTTSLLTDYDDLVAAQRVMLDSECFGENYLDKYMQDHSAERALFDKCIDFNLLDIPCIENKKYFGYCVRDKNIPLSLLIHALSNPPHQILEKFPFLAQQAGLEDVPLDYCASHIDPRSSPEKWVTGYSQEFPVVWYVVPYTAYAVLSAFEATCNQDSLEQRKAQ